MCKVDVQWMGGLMIGVTSVGPSHATQLSYAMKLISSTIMVHGKTFTVNGNEVISLIVYIGLQ